MLAVLLLGCVLDRTGQSITTAMRNEIIQNGSQIENLERQFDRLESRVSQVEDITRARGQEEIMNMESMEPTPEGAPLSNDRTPSKRPHARKAAATGAARTIGPRSPVGFRSILNSTSGHRRALLGAR